MFKDHHRNRKSTGSVPRTIHLNHNLLKAYKVTGNISILPAGIDDVHDIAVMVGELLNEIMSTIGIQAFNFSLDDTISTLTDLLAREKYFIFLAIRETAGPIGFIALYESHALYAEGAFGTIPELYVRPEFRSQKVGWRLLEQAKAFGKIRGWKRLEVTTPPLPPFNKTLAFYEREGFAVTGGRKLKVAL
jgi:GNAT superfamily N-acetyltransferase